uniref:Ig-like domain-containing protein n=1 Tax=Panagrolaimus sp. PS1159 TaxID=55785 RepID=A0AC35GPD9_9BILA
MPVLTSVTSLNSDGCTVLTVTCTGAAGAGVTITWFNNGVQVATSPSELMSNVLSRDITCNSSGEYVLVLTTPGAALQPVTSASCTTP